MNRNDEHNGVENIRKQIRSKLSVAIILAILLLGFSASFVPRVGAEITGSSAKVWTDKADYHPGTTVTIYGAGFTPFAHVSLDVIKVKDGTITNWNVISKADGSFTATYQIDKQGAPLYKVAASDGSDFAKTSFTDSVDQHIKVTMANGAPSATVVITDITNPTDSSNITADGTMQTVTMDGGDSFTLSFTNSGNSRDGFSNSGFSETSVTYTASDTEIDVTAFEQVQNTFAVTGISGTDTVSLTGFFLGSGDSTIII